MQHGDLRVNVSLLGEPQKLVTYWRGFLQDSVPVSASIKILRPYRRPRVSWRWDFVVPHLYFEPMTRTEKKRAELSISDRALQMEPEEIATARELTEVTFDWLSGRRGIPQINTPIPRAQLHLLAEGSEALLPVIERFNDPELLSRATIGAVYLQGEPRRPDVRWLPPLDDSKKAKALAEIFYFEKSLAKGQPERLRELVEMAARLFRKKRDARRTAVNRRYFRLFGMGGEVLFQDEPITDDMIEGYEYEMIKAWLDLEEQDRAKARARRQSTY